MKPRHALAFGAFVAAVFGVLMLALPSAVLEGFGAPVSEMAIVLARDVGTLYVLCAVIAWAARSWAEDGREQRTVVVVFAATQMLSAALNASSIVSGVLGTAAWPGVGVHVAVCAVLASSLVRRQ